MQAIYAETEKLDWIEKIPDTLAEVSDHFYFLFCYSYEISNTKCIEKHIPLKCSQSKNKSLRDFFHAGQTNYTNILLSWIRVGMTMTERHYFMFFCERRSSLAIFFFKKWVLFLFGFCSILFLNKSPEVRPNKFDLSYSVTSQKCECVMRILYFIFII